MLWGSCVVVDGATPKFSLDLDFNPSAKLVSAWGRAAPSYHIG